MRAEALGYEPEPWRAVGADPRSRVLLPRTAIARLHTPPRFSRKLTHTVRGSPLGWPDNCGGWPTPSAPVLTALPVERGGPRGELSAGRVSQLSLLRA